MNVAVGKLESDILRCQRYFEVLVQFVQSLALDKGRRRGCKQVVL